MAARLVRLTYNSINIDIETPQKADNDFEHDAKRKIDYSLSGVQQTAFDYNDQSQDLEFTFISAATKTLLTTMWTSWAVEGKQLTYYPDFSNTPGTSYTVIIISNKFEFKREAPGLDYWGIKFNVRKVIS